MAKQSVTCPACNGSGQDSRELAQMRGLHLQEMPIEVFTEEDWGRCKYCRGSGEVTNEEAEQYQISNRKEKRSLKRRVIIGGLVGLLAGIVSGSFIQISYAPLAFGVVGLSFGIGIGLIYHAYRF